MAGGVIGGLAGYRFGANREIECCAEPRTTPFTYTAFGAALGANVVMYLVTATTAVARALRLSRRATQGQPPPLCCRFPVKTRTGAGL